MSESELDQKLAKLLPEMLAHLKGVGTAMQRYIFGELDKQQLFDELVARAKAVRKVLEEVLADK